MFEINATLLIFALCFLIFTFLLNEIVLKPVGQTLERRKAIIQDNYDSARSFSSEGEAIVAQYMEHMQQIRSEAQKVIADSVLAAHKKRDEELHRLKAQGNEKLDKVRAELTGERGNLIASLVDPEVELVKVITSKLLGESSDVSIDRASVQRALEEAS
jgi:F-type H+-transporting ATPase subunit b